MVPFRLTRRLINVKHYFSTSTESLPAKDSKQNISGELSGKKKSFVKNLFLGVYDTNVLIFPEVLSNDQLKSVESNYLQLSNKIQDSTTALSVLNICTTVESNSGLEEDGSSLFTNLVRLSEAVTSPSHSLLLDVSRNFINNIINKYGSADQQKKFCLDLASGKKFASFALSEENTGSDPTCLKTTATEEKDGWKLNGKKIWVTGGELADIFLVFSKTSHLTPSDLKQLSVFLLDKSTPGVTIEPQECANLSECSFSTVNFKNVLLSKEHLVGELGDGYKVAADVLGTFKFNLATCVLQNLKICISHSVNYLISRKQTDTDLRDCELIRNVLGKISLNIYTLESMIYLTAGMKDTLNFDISSESAIIHLFCYQHCLTTFQDCFDLLGSKFYEDSHLEKLYRDLKALFLVFNSKNIYSLFIALTGIDYSTETLREEVLKMRNSLDYPVYYLKKYITNMRNRNDNPKLHLQLYTNLHPSLKSSADDLEFCVLKFHYAIEQFLIREGTEAVKRQMDLERISKVAMYIFAMTAVLGRASRSYCTGIQNCDTEMLLAVTFCTVALKRCKIDIEDILEGGIYSSDIVLMKIGDDIIKQKGYTIENPLVRNIS